MRVSGGAADRLLIVSMMGAAIAATIVLVIVGCSKGKSSSASKAPPPIPQLPVTTVVQKDVPIYAESIGTTEGFINAKILPKVSGYLLKQDYQDGAHVGAGALLFEIDDRPYKAALDQAFGHALTATGPVEAKLTAARPLYKVG